MSNARSAASVTATGSIAGMADSADLFPLASGTMTVICDWRLEGTLVVGGAYDVGCRRGGTATEGAVLDGMGVFRDGGTSVLTGGVTTEGAGTTVAAGELAVFGTAGDTTVGAG